MALNPCPSWTTAWSQLVFFLSESHNFSPTVGLFSSVTPKISLVISNFFLCNYFSQFSSLACLILYWYYREKFFIGHPWEWKDSISCPRLRLYSHKSWSVYQVKEERRVAIWKRSFDLLVFWNLRKLLETKLKTQYDQMKACPLSAAQLIRRNSEAKNFPPKFLHFVGVLRSVHMH